MCGGSLLGKLASSVKSPCRLRKSELRMASRHDTEIVSRGLPSLFSISRNGKRMAVIERRKGRDGQSAFRVKIRLKGFAPQSATFDRLSDAKLWGQSTEAAIREGRYFKVPE